jgi:predicted nucleic acid-binding protein
MRYLLDTNTCIRLMRGDGNVRQHLCSNLTDIDPADEANTPLIHQREERW